MPTNVIDAAADRRQAIAKAEQGMCEGSCRSYGTCRGPIVAVHVVDPTPPQRDWGYWAYCQEAIATDRESGFTVTPVEEEVS